MKQALVSLCFAGGIVSRCAVQVHTCLCKTVYVSMPGCASVVSVIEMTGGHVMICLTRAGRRREERSGS